MPSGTGILSPDAQIVSAGAACTRLRGMSPSVRGRRMDGAGRCAGVSVR